MWNPFQRKRKQVKEPDLGPAWKREGFYNERWYTNPDQTITVRVVQVPEDEIHRYCSAGGGCHKIIGGVHTIYVPRMKTDHEPITHQKLGHEIHHALGMKH